jgi:hypothetical protein
MKAQDRNGTRVYFPDETNFRIGAQAEFPIINGKWSIILEPTLQRYVVNRPYPLKYRSLETPLGVRRYFAANNKTGFFVNGAVVGDIVMEHAMELTPNFYFRSTKLAANFAAGVGVAVGRFTLEYRHYTQRTRKDDTGSFTYNYNKRSIIVGFRLY